MSKKTMLAAVVGAGLLAPASAQAHVTVNPNEAQAGAFTRLDVRVPSERDDADTVKVDLKLPDGFVFASYAPQPGWSVKVLKTKLAKPVKTDDGEVTQQVSRIVWTGSGKGMGKIGPGEFMDFPLSVQIPGKAGDTLVFKALQTYSDGQVVRWIGDESSDNPAPRVKLVAAGQVASGPAGHDPRPAASSGDSGSGSNGLAIAALVVGIVALAAAGGAVAAARRGARAAA